MLFTGMRTKQLIFHKAYGELVSPFLQQRTCMNTNEINELELTDTPSLEESAPKKKKIAPKKELNSVEQFTNDMKRPVRVKVKNLESTLPVYVSWHFDPDDAPGHKAIESDSVETLPLGAVLDLMINQTIYNEKPKYDLHGKYIGKQGANHTKYSVQLLDPIEDKYIEYVEKRTKMRQMIPA